MAEEERTWYTLKQAEKPIGMTAASMKNAISRGTFPFPTYKIGRIRVIDKAVLDAFFQAQREEGFKKMASADPAKFRHR